MKLKLLRARLKRIRGARSKMTDNGIVYLVESLDGNLESAQPIPVSNLYPKTDYAGLACKPCGTPTARYHPRNLELLERTLAGLLEGEILYVTPVRRSS